MEEDDGEATLQRNATVLRVEVLHSKCYEEWGKKSTSCEEEKSCLSKEKKEYGERKEGERKETTTEGPETGKGEEQMLINNEKSTKQKEGVKM